MEIGYRSFAALIYRFYHAELVATLFFPDTEGEPLRAGITSVLGGDFWRDDNPFQEMLLRSLSRKPGRPDRPAEHPRSPARSVNVDGRAAHRERDAHREQDEADDDVDDADRLTRVPVRGRGLSFETWPRSRKTACRRTARAAPPIIRPKPTQCFTVEPVCASTTTWPAGRGMLKPSDGRIVPPPIRYIPCGLTGTLHGATQTSCHFSGPWTCRRARG